MKPIRPNVCVIVAAYNAQTTIARALRSALAQAEVSEVIVIDDCSSDGTCAAARAQDDGSGRLRIIRQTVNAGPAAARNRALEVAEAAYIAILDADDFLLPGRFSRILEVHDWDMIADNIAFVPEAMAGDFDPQHLPRFAEELRDLTLAQFIAGNVTQPGRPRGELGFAKPVIRRAFLEQHGLRYDESLRLGEDYALYTCCLAAGARFATLGALGYVAIERAGSLSGLHRTEDLGALLAFDRGLAKDHRLDRAARRALALHAAQVEAKTHLRTMLDLRRERGRLRALIAAAAHPRLFAGLLTSVSRDKWSTRKGKPAASDGPGASGGEVRYLFG